MESRVELDDPHGSLPAQGILWFCDSNLPGNQGMHMDLLSSSI